MEEKGVVPMPIPVSIYGYPGLKWSSLGKEMADAGVAFLLKVSSGTIKMALGSWTDHETPNVSEERIPSPPEQL